MGYETFPPSSAGGITAFRPQHLKKHTSFSIGETANLPLESWTDFATLDIAGCCLSFVHLIFLVPILMHLQRRVVVFVTFLSVTPYIILLPRL